MTLTPHTWRTTHMHYVSTSRRTVQNKRVAIRLGTVAKRTYGSVMLTPLILKLEQNLTGLTRHFMNESCPKANVRCLQPMDGLAQRPVANATNP